jgi:GNAT superfamily N-acetyltransferase
MVNRVSHPVMSNIVRELSDADVVSLCLPLRFSVLHKELKWTKRDVDSPELMTDEYDRGAIHYGAFCDSGFAGSLRLVIQKSARELPSGSFIPITSKFSGTVGELSKGMVYPHFRGRRVFCDLIEKCIARAHAEGVEHLFLSAYSSLRERRFYQLFGFEVIETGFDFSDSLISPSGSAGIFYRRLQRVDGDEETGSVNCLTESPTNSDSAEALHPSNPRKEEAAGTPSAGPG